MIYSEEEILHYVEENDVKFVKLTFCDISGKLKNISVLSSELGTVFKNGVKINGRRIEGFSAARGRDLYLFPDASAMTLLPWRPQHGRAIRMFCFIKYKDGTPFEGDSRYFLKKAMEAAVSKGFCFRFGTSCEFTLFKTDENGLPTKTPHDYAGYCDIAPDDKGENIRREVCLTLEKMGIQPLSSRHQSAFGQHEIDFSASPVLRAADTFLSFKSAVKSVAEISGVFASFMPKPLKDADGNCMHISFNMLRCGDILDETSENDESILPVLHSAVSGIMKYIREFAIFTDSTVNSYDRLCEYAEPRSISWSELENEQLFKLSVSDAREPIVFRAADCACNPYYTFGLMIYAALEGIDKELALPEENSSKGEFPRTLAEAAETAERSDFLKRYVPESVLSEIVSRAENECKESAEEYDRKNNFYSF